MDTNTDNTSREQGAQERPAAAPGKEEQRMEAQVAEKLVARQEGQAGQEKDTDPGQTPGDDLVDEPVIDLVQLVGDEESPCPAAQEEACADEACADEDGTIELDMLVEDTAERSVGETDAAHNAAMPAATSAAQSAASPPPPAAPCAEVAVHVADAQTSGTDPVSQQPSPLVLGMLPGLVDRVNRLSHDCSVLHDRLERLALRQNRLEEAGRRLAGQPVPAADTNRRPDEGILDDPQLKDRLLAESRQCVADLDTRLATRFGELEERLGAIAGETDAAKTVAEGTRASLEALSREVQSVREQTGNLQDGLETRLEACQQAHPASVDMLEDRLAQLEQTFAAQDMATRAQDEELGASVEALLQRVLQLEAEQQTLQTEGSRLTEEMESRVQAHLDKVPADLATRLQDCEDQLGLLASHEDMTKGQQELFATLDTLMAANKEDRDALTARLDTISGSVDALSRHLDELGSSLDSRLSEKLDEAAGLHRVLQQQEERTHAENARLAALEERLENRLQEGMAALDGRCASLETAGDERLAALQEELSRGNQQAEVRFQDLGQHLERIGHEVAANTHACAASATRLDGLEEQCRSLADSLVDTEAPNSPAEKLQRLQERQENLAREVARNSEACAAAAAKIAEMDHLSTLLDEMLEARVNLTRQLTQLAEQNRQLTERLAACEARLEGQSLEDLAARACARVLREEIDRLKGGSAR